MIVISAVNYLNRGLRKTVVTMFENKELTLLFWEHFVTAMLSWQCQNTPTKIIEGKVERLLPCVECTCQVVDANEIMNKERDRFISHLPSENGLVLKNVLKKF